MPQETLKTASSGSFLHGQILQIKTKALFTPDFHLAKKELKQTIMH